MIASQDGTWTWILIRLAVVGLMLAGLLWTVHRRRWTTSGAIVAGLVAIPFS